MLFDIHLLRRLFTLGIILIVAFITLVSHYIFMMQASL